MADTPKTCTAQEAAALVNPRDSLGMPMGPGQPSSFVHALGERDDFEDLRVFTALLVDLFSVFTRGGVTLYSGFFGPVERAFAQAGYRVEFVPADFRRFTYIAERMRPRVMATLATPPDRHGQMSLSLHAGATVDELVRCGRDPARLLIVEINPRLPRTLGLPPHSPHALTLDEVDVLVESDREIFAIPDPEPSQIECAIAKHVVSFVSDGCALQTGSGAIPSEIVEQLARGSGGDYGVHTEMFTTGLLRMHQAGKVSNRKGIHDGYSVATFAAGTPELYEWLDGQSEVRFLPVEAVNDPAIIARNRKLISINGALAIDLNAQVAADAVGGRQYSGIGGHLDFMMGAAFSPHGRSLVCLPSTVTIDGRTESRITGALPPGTLVTSPRHEIDVVITEHGAAELAGRTVQERAESLISIADPRFRDELRETWNRARHRV